MTVRIILEPPIGLKVLMLHFAASAMDPALVKWNGMFYTMQLPVPRTTLPSPRNTNTVVDMHANRHKYFRWTPRTAGITFAYVVVFPAIVGYLAYTTDVRLLTHRERERDASWYDLLTVGSWQGKWNLRGKLRGDPIAE
jgi:hypothetical protein